MSVTGSDCSVTKSAAAKDLLEALQEEQILDEIEIKQEIVLDPNE
jgi:hypothetical protein